MAAIFMSAALMPEAVRSDQQSGVGPCRIGAQSLIAMLDDGENNTARYREVYAAVVQTCGPLAAVTGLWPLNAGKEECRKLALAMLDIIENGKMNSGGFVQARSHFAQSCAPR